MAHKAIVATKAANPRCLIVLLSAILIAWFSIPVMAEFNSLGTWRSEVALARMQAENNATAAYKEARRLQAILPTDATTIDQVRLLNLLSRIEIYLAMTQAAATHVQQALDLAKKHGDRIGQAEADLNIAMNAINQNNIDAMVAAVTDSMVILEGVNRPDLIGEAMLRTSMMYRRLEQFDDSISMVVKNLEIAQHNNNPLARTYAYQGMAAMYDLSLRHKEALDYYIKMRDQARVANSKLLESDALLGMGGTANTLGDKHGGERLVQEAIANYRVAGGPFHLAHALFTQAGVLGAEHRFAEAVSILNEVVAIYGYGNNKIGQWWALNARSQNYQSLGKISLSAADAEHAYQLAKKIGFSLYLSDSARRMATIAERRGDHRLAYKLLVEANEMSAKAAREKVATRVVELASHYEAEIRQSQINELNRRNERQVSEIRRQALQKRWLVTLVVGGLTVLAITVFFLVRLRRSHQQLQRFQRHQQAILDAIPDLMFELGLDGRYYNCHALHPDLLVASVASFLGKTVSDVMPKDAAEVCLSALQEAYEKGISTGNEICVQLSQGMCWFELSVTRKATEKGEEPHFIMLSRDITERKRLETTLYEREREFRTLAENSPDNIIRYDLQCRMRYVNPQLEKTVGKPAHELLGKTPNEARGRPNANYDDYSAKIEAVIRTGQDHEIELTLPDTGEGERYHHIRFVAEHEPNGNIVGVLAMGRDITEFRRVELLLHNLSDNIPGVLGAYRQRPDGSSHQVYASPGLYGVFGVEFDEVKNDSTPRLKRVHPDDMLSVMAIMAESVHTMTSGWNEYRVNHPTKGEIWVETYATPVREYDGSIIWYGYSAEVTERHQLQDAVKEREREFRTLAEHSPEIIVRYDRNFRRIYINPAYARQSGISIEHAWNETPDEVWKPLMLPEEYMARLMHIMETGAPEHILLEWHGLDGGLVSHQMHAVAEYDEQKNVVGVLVVGHNITALKETERQLEESQYLLRQLAARSEVAREDERKSLAREVHDELGQYLMALRMNMTAVGLAFGENNPALQEDVSQLIALLDTTIQVVRNIVVSLRPSVLDMGIIPALEWLADEYQKRTEIQCALQILDEDIYLDDKRATAVFRIVQESLTNIGRHAKASKVEIVLEQKEKQYELEVRDNGKGFDPDMRKDQSFGLLGMRERVITLGGELEIASAPERGTVIKVSIPVNYVWSEE